MEVEPGPRDLAATLADIRLPALDPDPVKVLLV
jgi:hypothetical protein